jgi:hypothetical protein
MRQLAFLKIRLDLSGIHSLTENDIAQVGDPGLKFICDYQRDQREKISRRLRG